jgi:hypothetical protein
MFKLHMRLKATVCAVLTGGARTVIEVRLIRLLAIAATLIAVAAAPAVASAATASAISASQTYSLAGTGSSVPGGGGAYCQAPAMDAAGTAICSVCVAGKPASGDFAISLVVLTFPPSPCKVKSVSGVLDMTWGDGTTSSATVSGKFRGSRALSLAGTFSPADAVYPSASVTILLSNYPPSPCLAATNPMAGTLALSSP